MLEPIVVLVVLIYAFLAILMVRNWRLYRYRVGLIDAAHEIAQFQIADRTWDGHNYDMIESASYGEMAWKLWRSFDSFYPPDWEVFAWRDHHVYKNHHRDDLRLVK